MTILLKVIDSDIDENISSAILSILIKSPILTTLVATPPILTTLVATQSEVTVPTPKSCMCGASIAYRILEANSP
jgi:hypothetical protein